MAILQKYKAIVEHGKKLGRKLGFPTANIYLTSNLQIKYGVYVVKIIIKNETHYGVANYGIKPTIGDNIKAIEVHIFDFNKLIYNQEIEIIFIKQIRDEIKFDSIELLKQQIAKDSSFALEYLENISIIYPDFENKSN